MEFDGHGTDISKLPPEQLKPIVNGMIRNVKRRYPLITDPEVEVWDIVNDIINNPKIPYIYVSFFHRSVYRQIARKSKSLQREQDYFELEMIHLSRKLSDSFEAIESHIVKEDIICAIRAALELEEDVINKRIFMLRHFDQEPFDLIAKCVSLSIKAVQARDKRTITRIRKHLKARGFLDY